MTNNNCYRKNYAVTAVIGNLIILAIAVLVFGMIVYMQILQPNLAPVDKNVELIGYVTYEGRAVIEHVGGQSISDYKVIVNQVDGTHIETKEYSNLESLWSIGDCKYPLDDIGYAPLINNTDMVEVIVYIFNQEGDEQLVFNGILTGVYREDNSPVDPMLISSLMKNTVDEDLICFNYTINSSINPLTNIYNWIVNGNSITNILMPFDTNTTEESFVRDYSGDDNHGLINGPIWYENGVVGGAKYFDGNDNISIPYCYDDNDIDEITVEMWIKTSSDNMVLATYNRDEYWELGVADGAIRWSTTVNGNTIDLNGDIIVNDNAWHHIAITYDYITGMSAIYVDGSCDENIMCHNIGDQLGSGNTTSGFIGRGLGSASEVTILSTSFETSEEESKWSKDNDRTTAWWGYDFDRLTDDSLSPRTGTYSIGGTGNFDPYYAAYNRESIDISGFEDVKVSIWYSYKSTESADEIGFYYWDNPNWVEVFEELDPDIGNGNQVNWTNVEVDIPNDIDDLILQFWWSTSESREYMAVDDLVITGVPTTDVGNYSGYMDEFRIYRRALSSDQIYQNYLINQLGVTDKSVLVSQETNLGEIWKCIVTPNNSLLDDIAVESNSLQIIGYLGG